MQSWTTKVEDGLRHLFVLSVEKKIFRFPEAIRILHIVSASLVHHLSISCEMSLQLQKVCLKNLMSYHA